MWGNLKTHQISNLIATQAWDLSVQATAARVADAPLSPPATNNPLIGQNDTLLSETQ
jgi:hypothetical protein